LNTDLTTVFELLRLSGSAAAVFLDEHHPSLHLRPSKLSSIEAKALDRGT
jgi:hypothetical protein